MTGTYNNKNDFGGNARTSKNLFNFQKKSIIWEEMPMTCSRNFDSYKGK